MIHVNSIAHTHNHYLISRPLDICNVDIRKTTNLANYCACLSLFGTQRETKGTMQCSTHEYNRGTYFAGIQIMII